MKTLITIATALLATSAISEQYRLKLPTTVDILEDGAVTGSKRLKAGTVIEIAESEAEAKAKPANEKAASEMPYKLFISQRPKKGAWFRCAVELGDYYNFDFDGKQSVYQSISLKAYKPDGQDFDTSYGYVKKASPVGKRLMTLIKDGNDHLIFAKLIPMTNRDDDSCILEDFKPISE